MKGFKINLGRRPTPSSTIQSRPISFPQSQVQYDVAHHLMFNLGEAIIGYFLSLYALLTH